MGQAQQQLLEAPEEIQVQGLLVQKVSVPWCCTWQRGPGGVSSLGQPCQSTSTSAQESWTGASEINWSQGDARELAAG